MELTNIFQHYDLNRAPLEDPNSSQLDSSVQVFLCPSDPHSGNVHTAQALGDVRLAHTNFLGSLSAGESRGMFPYSQGIRIGEVTDGTSQTLFVGERGVVFDGVNTHGWWAWGAGTTVAPTQPLRPGSYEDPGAIIHWWGYHPGGVNFLFVDGSVRFVANGIDAEVFAALGSRNLGDIGQL